MNAESIRKIFTITLDDGLIWLSPQGAPLNHPEMDYPGVRIKCAFKLGTAKGLVRMDLAVGDLVEARKISLQTIRYRGKPLLGSDFSIMAYPPESIFAEKLQIAVKRGEQNTRMKDYYDLFKLIQSEKLDPPLLRKSIEKTFSKRTTEIKTIFTLTDDALEKLQTYWSAYIRKMKIPDAPKTVKDIVHAVNRQLETIYNNEQ